MLAATDPELTALDVMGFYTVYDTLDSERMGAISILYIRPFVGPLSYATSYDLILLQDCTVAIVLDLKLTAW
jgi:hypothetical protein